jgi:hypothetical protein
MHEQAIIRKLMHVVSTIRADLSQNVHCKFSLAANRRQYTTCNVLCKFPLTAKLCVRCSLKPFPRSPSGRASLVRIPPMANSNSECEL